MKKITDYNFCDSWQLKKIGINAGKYYDVLMDLGDLKKSGRVEFIGFDDVDNHYGIFVFADLTGKLLEVSGDFSSQDSALLKSLQATLSLS